MHSWVADARFLVVKDVVRINTVFAYFGDWVPVVGGTALAYALLGRWVEDLVALADDAVAHVVVVGRRETLAAQFKSDVGFAWLAGSASS